MLVKAINCLFIFVCLFVVVVFVFVDLFVFFSSPCTKVVIVEEYMEYKLIW